MNIIDKFLEISSVNPAFPFCIFKGQVITRGLFYQLTCKVALELHQRGIGPGDVVGVSMDHSPMHLATLLALARLGAVTLPVHPSTAAPVKTRLMARYGAKRLICNSNTPDLPGIEKISLDELQVDASSKLDMGFIEYWPEPTAPARIGLTSGTTGQAGAILYTQAYWLDRIGKYADTCDAQSRMMPSDLHLTMGSLCALGALFAGGVLVFIQLNDLQAYAKAVNLYAVTHAFMPPAMVKGLVANLPYDGVAFPTIRDLKFIGSGLSPHLIELATRKLTPCIFLPYGTSEIGRISLATPELLASHPDYAGRVDAGVEVQAVDAEGLALPPGELGELRVRCPDMPKSYYLNEERSALRFKDGWFMTGDIGWVTKDGLVKIDGRLDDRINLEGVKFYPEQVESVLNAHPELKESAVFVIEGQDKTQLLMAVIVAKHPPPLDLKLVDFCRQKKLGRMTPQRYVWVRELPRNPTGKIMRSALPDLIRAPKEVQH
jgi:acyl-coenzyme A synthetase/AMP-(fatty) acid ligase